MTAPVVAMALVIGVAGVAPASATVVAAGAPTSKVVAATVVPAPLPTDATPVVATGTQGAGAGAIPVASATKKPAAFDPATAKVVSRAATSTDYLNTDGSHTSMLSTVPQNFQDPTGSWKAIDNTLTADPDQTSSSTTLLTVEILGCATA